MKRSPYFNLICNYIIIFTILLYCFTSLGVVAQVHGADDTSTNDTELRGALDTIKENKGILLILINFILISLLIIFVYYIKSVTRLIKEQTAEIEEKRKLLEDVIRHCSIGIAVMDLSDHCKHILFNETMGKYFGVKPEEIIGTKPFYNKMRVDGGASLTRLCFQKRGLIDVTVAYNTNLGEKIHYMLVYPIFESFDETKDIRYIVTNTIDRTKEFEFEREIQASLEKFGAFFEKDVTAVALYEPFYSNEKVLDFHVLEMNPEWKDLVGSFGDHVTEKEPYFLAWVEALNSKKPNFFRNWYIKESDIYISGCVLHISSECICVIATDATYVVQLCKNERVLLGHLQTNISNILSLSASIRGPLAEMINLLAGEEHLFVEAIEKQINSISMFCDQFEKGLISSEKIELHLINFYQLSDEDIERTYKMP